MAPSLGIRSVRSAINCTWSQIIKKKKPAHGGGATTHEQTTAGFCTRSPKDVETLLGGGEHSWQWLLSVGSAEPEASRPPRSSSFSQADDARLPTRCTTGSGLEVDVATHRTSGGDLQPTIYTLCVKLMTTKQRPDTIAALIVFETHETCTLPVRGCQVHGLWGEVRYSHVLQQLWRHAF